LSDLIRKYMRELSKQMENVVISIEQKLFLFCPA
jgi:hypothetical protein